MASSDHRPTPSTSIRFVEIDDAQSSSSSEKEPSPDRIECYVLENVEPKRVGPLARDLNAVLPLRIPPVAAKKSKSSSSSATAVDDDGGGDDENGDVFLLLPKTDHLKRIRRRPATADEKSRCSGSSPSDEQQHPTDGDENNGAVAAGDENNPSKKRSKPNDGSGPQRKRERRQKSSPWSLDVLVGSVASVDRAIETSDRTSSSSSAPSTATTLISILEKYRPSSTPPSSPVKSFLSRRSLPGRPARDRTELDEWNGSLWPTLYFEEKTVRHKEERLALTRGEIVAMRRGMREALEDAREGRRQREEWDEQRNHDGEEGGIEGRTDRAAAAVVVAGVVVVNPADGSVVSRASEERRMQGTMMREAEEEEEDGGGRNGGPRGTENIVERNAAWFCFPDDAAENPLCTPTLLAIQGVSRRERRRAVAGCGGMTSDEFRSGQYLCTGHDVYLTKEPNAYEAMTLVHSRVRRVTFGVRDEEAGGLGGAALANGTSGDRGRGRVVAGIHSLPGTNHHYRAFRLEATETTGDEVVGGGDGDGDGDGKDDHDDCDAAELLESLQELHVDLNI